MRVGASGSVLGRGQIAQRRVPMSTIVFMLEVADHHLGFEQVGPMV
ncbi:hypothetical protein MGAST_23080 [Mycobacterium gastri 'Wayne']|nr:hypothetical protein MGAST_23080 [Mycobacterium gastri 'Wayne']